MFVIIAFKLGKLEPTCSPISSRNPPILALNYSIEPVTLSYAIFPFCLIFFIHFLKISHVKMKHYQNLNFLVPASEFLHLHLPATCQHCRHSWRLLLHPQNPPSYPLSRCSTVKTVTSWQYLVNQIPLPGR
jgi:hypothetical protein